MNQLINEFYALIGLALAGIGSHFNLKSQARSNKEGLERLEKRQDRYEESNSALLKEIRDDIKRLIERK